MAITLSAGCGIIASLESAWAKIHTAQFLYVENTEYSGVCQSLNIWINGEKGGNGSVPGGGGLEFLEDQACYYEDEACYGGKVDCFSNDEGDQDQREEGDQIDQVGQVGGCF